MKKPFAVGDLVRVYCPDGLSFDSRIAEINKDGDGIRVVCSPCLWHHKQCRRLIKKERRRVWVSPDFFDTKNVNFGGICDSARGGWIEFIEIKKK